MTMTGKKKKGIATPGGWTPTYGSAFPMPKKWWPALQRGEGTYALPESQLDRFLLRISMGYPDRKAERPAFIRVLKAIPEASSNYRPDPKAWTAAELAWLLAVEETALLSLIDSGEVQWKESPPPPRVETAVTTFEHKSAEVNARLESLDPSGWEKKVRFLMEGGAWEDTLSQMVWGFLFDAIHHRGQLCTYLRPMGSKVPAIYGPSADDKGE